MALNSTNAEYSFCAIVCLYVIMLRLDAAQVINREYTTMTHGRLPEGLGSMNEIVSMDNNSDHLSVRTFEKPRFSGVDGISTDSWKIKKRDKTKRNELRLQSSMIHKRLLETGSQSKKHLSKFSSLRLQQKRRFHSPPSAYNRRRLPSTEITRIRKKRSIVSPANHHQTGYCSKRSLMIDFEKIGWSIGIVYPRRYEAFYCAGKCPLSPDPSYDSTNHAVLQGLSRLVDKRQAPRPCCVPTSLKPISMLYYENNDIVARQRKDMVVDKCGCR